MYNTTEDLLFIGLILLFFFGAICLFLGLYLCIYYYVMHSNIKKINIEHSSLSPLPQDV